MPSVNDIGKLSSAKVLASGSSAADDVDALRKADGLTLRRLGWSILLRSLGVLARDLDADDWSTVRKGVYRFANDHVIRADKILEYLDKIPWLFTIAISVRDYPEASDILYRTREALREIQEASSHEILVNGCKGTDIDGAVWKETDESITRFFREALIRSFDFSLQDSDRKSLIKILADLGLTQDELDDASTNALNSDWARIPYRYAQETHVRRAVAANEEVLHSLYPRFQDLEEFLQRRKSISDFGFDMDRPDDAAAEESFLPYLFPTRPYLPEEIALLAPEECVFSGRLKSARNWSRYVRALRGIWTKPDDLLDLPINSHAADSRETLDEKNVSIDPMPPVVELGGDGLTQSIRLGISSFAVRDSTWNSSASGSNDVSPRRYDEIQGIVNQAIEAKPRPDYLILPELALPARWIGTVSQLLRQAGISLIAGVDYSYPTKNSIYSSAVLSLRDERLGYPSTIQIRQVKNVPSPKEDQRLQHLFGRDWASYKGGPKPVYNHFGFYFSVLVCSELSNIEYRRFSQGNVDSLFVLAWNQDIETFSALTESAALDVHSYIALCNNREYGDSRVRAPMKNSWDRDLCRLRGGLNDHLVVVDLDIKSLRQHQSRAVPWPQDGDKYKPVPEGFRIADVRRTNPG